MGKKLAKRLERKWLERRVSFLEASMTLRRQGENQLNRRIDNLIETVTEVDKRVEDLSSNRDNSNTGDVT